MMEIKVYFDGACSNNGNDGLTGIGCWGYRTDTSERLFEVAKHAGMGTNNTAEYKALIEALRVLIEAGYTNAKVRVFGDSMLVINHVVGSWKCKAENLKPLLLELQNLRKEFKDIDFDWVPRESNSEADKLSKEGLEFKNIKNVFSSTESSGEPESLKILDLEDGIYKIITPSGRAYAVDVNDNVCTCLFYQENKTECDHLCAVLALSLGL